MKFYSKMLLLVVVLVLGFGVAPLFIKGSDGRPMMSISDWIPERASANDGMGRLDFISDKVSESLNQLDIEVGAIVGGGGEVGQVTENSPTQLSSSSGKMYKWKDANGKWHFSSQKPLETSSVSIEDLPTVENVMVPTVVESEDSSIMGGSGGLSLDGASALFKRVQGEGADKNK